MAPAEPAATLAAPPAVDPAAAHVVARLRELDPDRLTPLEALAILAELKRTTA